MATDLTEAATQAVTGQPSTPAVDARKRRFLLGATSVVGGIGIAASAVPFVMSFFPSERAKAAGAPVEVDIAKLEPGQKIDVEWRGKVVWLINRTPDMLASLPKVEPQLARPEVGAPQQPAVREERRRARSSPRSSSRSASARTSAARRRIAATSRPRTSAPTGSAASSARATSRSSTSPAASTRACPRRRTSSFRPIAISPTRGS